VFADLADSGIVGGVEVGLNRAGGRVVSAVRKLGTQMAGAGGGGAAGSGAGGSGAVQVQFSLDGSSGTGINGLFWEWFKHEVRLKGGGGTNSVQRALGQAW
jgi:hypothetical protein